MYIIFKLECFFIFFKINKNIYYKLLFNIKKPDHQISVVQKGG